MISGQRSGLHATVGGIHRESSGIKYSPVHSYLLSPPSSSPLMEHNHLLYNHPKPITRDIVHSEMQRKIHHYSDKGSSHEEDRNPGKETDQVRYAKKYLLHAQNPKQSEPHPTTFNYGMDPLLVVNIHKKSKNGRDKMNRECDKISKKRSLGKVHVVDHEYSSNDSDLEGNHVQVFIVKLNPRF